MTSTLPIGDRRLHVAIIMDGNGRWANRRGLPRTLGHREGAKAVRRVVEAAPDCGIETLTLYAFSADNWRRPLSEVRALMSLFREYLRSETDRCVQEGVRVSVIGRRDRLPSRLRAAVAATEEATRTGGVLHLRLAIDYSGRDALVAAARRLDCSETVNRAAFARALGEATHNPGPAPDVDLLIRTGGEHRISDFLLWEVAYAELFFTPRMWPEFDSADLALAVWEFHNRERRFGRLPQAAAG
ncbi:MAG: di-trans,poly-cis-decaprenylcistransferase [Acidobacteria bacterium]|nr:di-trans,poly-cis-decaprenylcistransferase [Acidobacteriota bacterium]